MKICGYTVIFLVYGGMLLIVHAYMDHRFAAIFFVGSLLICGVLFGYMCEKKTRDKRKYENIIDQLQKNVASCEQRQSDLYFLRSPLAVIEWNPDFTVHSWNKKAEEIFGYTAEEMIGQHASNIIPKRHQDKAKDVMDAILMYDKSRQDNFKNVTKGGEEIYCEWFNTPITDAYGHITVYSLVQDITQKKRAEIDLRENKSKLDDIFNALHDMVYVIESDGTITYANQRAYNLLEVSEDERGSVHYSQLLSEEEQKIAYDRIRNLLSGNGKMATPQIYHLKKRGDNGHVLPVEIITVPFKENGKMKVLGVARLISERLELDYVRARHQKMKSIGVLASGVAHDFNNLLMMISGSASLMMRGGSDSKEDYCEKILLAVERAAMLTRQLSVLSNEGNTKKQMSFVSDIAQQTAKIIGSSTPCKFSFDFPEDLKACLLDSRINEVFQNLFINAIHAMSGGGVIHVSGKNVEVENDNRFLLTPGSYVHVSVKDSGTGISEENLLHIFEPYFTTKSVTGGTGLGLYVTYSAIVENGGFIDVKSKLGEGTTFHLYLPATNSIVSKEQVVDSAKLQVKKLSILAVDDMDMNRKLLVDMLGVIGHVCDVAAEGKEGLTLYRKAMEANKPYDLVITDITMPGGMGGIELIKELRKINEDVIIIVSSGYVDNMPENIAGILPKPHTVSKLEKAIHYAMQISMT